MKILLGTRNKGKYIEISSALSSLPVTLISPDEAGIADDPEEHGQTYQENALIKSRFYFGASSLPTVADDSGLAVEALAGELGVYTRRWGAGKDATDKEWIEHFLARMRTEQNKNARFVSTIAYIDPQGQEHIFEGICDGVITETLEADYLPGLPLLACFKPKGFDRVFSHLTPDEKNSVNHRHHAVSKLKHHLSSFL